MDQNLELVREHFSDPAAVEDYAERAKRDLLAWERRVLADWMQPPGAVLDVGCGGGREAFHLHDLGYRVTGVDLSPRQVESARQAAERTGRAIDFRVCDGRTYDFADGTFDWAVVWQQVLGNVPGRAGRAAVLREVGRVLRPGGRVSASVHSLAHCLPEAERRGMVVRPGPEPGDFILRDGHSDCFWHYFHREELAELFGSAGLRVLALDGAPAFGMAEDWSLILVCVAEKI